MGIREHLKHIVEHLLGSSPVFEPVADDCDFEFCKIHVVKIFPDSDGPQYIISNDKINFFQQAVFCSRPR